MKELLPFIGAILMIVTVVGYLMYALMRPGGRANMNAML